MANLNTRFAAARHACQNGFAGDIRNGKINRFGQTLYRNARERRVWRKTEIS